MGPWVAVFLCVCDVIFSEAVPTAPSDPSPPLLTINGLSSGVFGDLKRTKRDAGKKDGKPENSSNKL